MSVRRLDPQQPASFEFSDETLAWAKAQIAKHPEGKQASAVIPLLWRAQEQHDGWLPEPAIRYVGEMLGMAEIRVLEVATFYTMFQLSPVGKKAHVQVCGTTPCMLRGSEDLIKVCKSRIASRAHELSEDGDFSWEEVECLGACANAPMVQIWSDTYEDLTAESFNAVLDAFARGERPKPGSQSGRQNAAPSGGLTSLLSIVEGATTSGSHDGTRAADSAGAATAGYGAATDAPGQHAGRSQGGVAATADEARATAAKPEALTGPRNGKADDLKLISGVGPKLEGVLNELGIYHFSQIADWSPETVAWVDDFLSFKGRIDREDWIAQAKKLAAG